MDASKVYAGLFLAVVLLTACEQTVERPYELTRDDIFSLANVTSTQVSVKGIGLGDSNKTVIRTLGKPDKTYAFDDAGIVNYEYGASIGTEGTGLIVQLQNGRVVKITVKEPFNKYLQGSTKIDFNKEDLYFRMLGLPDRQETNPWFRVMHYDERGIEVFIEHDPNGFALREPIAGTPKRKLTPEELAAFNDTNNTNVSA